MLREEKGGHKKLEVFICLGDLHGKFELIMELWQPKREIKVDKSN